MPAYGLLRFLMTQRACIRVDSLRDSLRASSELIKGSILSCIVGALHSFFVLFSISMRFTSNDLCKITILFALPTWLVFSI